MADPGRGNGSMGRGMGRGFLLDQMRKAQDATAPSPVVTPTPTPASSAVPRGRGSLLASLKQVSAPPGPTPTPESSTVSTPKPVASTIPRGRGSILASVLSNVPPVSPGSIASSVYDVPGVGRGTLLSRSQASSDDGSSKKLSKVGIPVPAAKGSQILPPSSGDNLGVTGPLSLLNIDNLSTTSGTSLTICRQGESGKTIDIMSNYIDLEFVDGKGIYRYEVKYSPETDSPKIRNALLNQHLEQLGKTKTFDGMTLYLPKKLPERITRLVSLRHDKTEVEITVIFQRLQLPHESMQFFNVLLNKVMRCLQMVRINRNNFNPRCAHKIQQHRMELWPGYITAIEEVEGGLKLNIDANHRVMRTDTVYDFIKLTMQESRGGNPRDTIFSDLVGVTVLTRYNNETYRIDDILWDKNPLFEFDCKGKATTLAEYYKVHWNLTIKDVKQPLLLHRAKKRLTQGGTKEEEILLIPELCYMTGLTDKIRSDFKIMRDLASVTQVVPEARRQVIKKFIDDVKKHEVAGELLKSWGLKMASDLTRFKGRTLDPDTIIHGGGKRTVVNDKADWSGPTTKSPMLRVHNLSNWFICSTERDAKFAKEFVKLLQTCSRDMGMIVKDPIVVALKNDSTQSYINEIRKVINPSLEMVVCVVPTIRADRYSAIKKLCCVESPIKSQVIVTKTISNDKKIKSVTEKIALQMNCKMGGALWALKMPFTDVMVVGIDVFHAGVGQKAASVAGFIASLDENMTTWHSNTCHQAPGQELIDLLKVCLVTAIKAYHRYRGVYPNRIIIYRDGVGDGQLSLVAGYEVEQLKKAFEIVERSYEPKITMIIVQKRINTRIMALVSYLFFILLIKFFNFNFNNF